MLFIFDRPMKGPKLSVLRGAGFSADREVAHVAPQPRVLWSLAHGLRRDDGDPAVKPFERCTKLAEEECAFLKLVG